MLAELYAEIIDALGELDGLVSLMVLQIAEAVPLRRHGEVVALLGIDVGSRENLANLHGVLQRPVSELVETIGSAVVDGLRRVLERALVVGEVFRRDIRLRTAALGQREDAERKSPGIAVRAKA